jgi:hypothetical protein
MTTHDIAAIADECSIDTDTISIPHHIHLTHAEIDALIGAVAPGRTMTHMADDEDGETIYLDPHSAPRVTPHGGGRHRGIGGYGELTDDIMDEAMLDAVIGGGAIEAMVCRSRQELPYRRADWIEWARYGDMMIMVAPDTRADYLPQDPEALAAEATRRAMVIIRRRDMAAEAQRDADRAAAIDWSRPWQEPLPGAGSRSQAVDYIRALCHRVGGQQAAARMLHVAPSTLRRWVTRDAASGADAPWAAVELLRRLSLDMHAQQA